MAYARAIIVGDVHGCLEELDDLLSAAGYRHGRDRIVLVGDMLDRGPDPVGTVRRVRELGAESVLGNHEEKALRWLRKEDERLRTGRPNGMRPPFPDRQMEWEALSPDDVGWLSGLPTVLEVFGWTVVHAGFEPRLPVADQDDDKIVRCQYVTAEGKYVGQRSGFRRPEGALFWAEAWPGPENVVYGHSVHSYQDPTFFRGASVCVGIDTGCVFGGRLTGMVLFPEGGHEFVQVPARDTYMKPRKLL